MGCKAKDGASEPEEDLGSSDNESGIEDEEKSSEEGSEAWTDLIQCVTKLVEEEAKKVKLASCIQEQRRRKWMWVDHIPRRDDGRCTGKVFE